MINIKNRKSWEKQTESSLPLDLFEGELLRGRVDDLVLLLVLLRQRVEARVDTLYWSSHRERGSGVTLEPRTRTREKKAGEGGGEPGRGRGAGAAGRGGRARGRGEGARDV